MNKIKFLLLILVCIYVVLFINIKVLGISSNDFEEDNLYFKSDEIIVILTQSESLLFKEYDLNYFGDINCIKIDDLTSSYKKKYLENDTNVCFENFRRILKLTVQESETTNIQSILEEIKKREEVFCADLNYLIPIQKQHFNPSITPEDMIDGIDWALESIQLDECYEILPDNCTEVNVGVFDSGIYIDNQDQGYYEYHEEFEGIDVILRNYVNQGYTMSDNNDKEGHGTFVSSIIAAKRHNGKGINGVYNNLNLYMYKITDSSMFDLNNFVYTGILISAINDAVNDNVNILNISYGFEFDSMSQPDNNKLNQIWQAFGNFPGLIVCASGNYGFDIDEEENYLYPANYEFTNIITVGALAENNNKWNNSNYGKNNVDIFAPGEEIYAATIPSSSNSSLYMFDSGTSYATAYVTGVAAILLSINTNLTPCMIKQILLTTVQNNENLEDYCVSGGSLNAYNAVTYLLSINEEINEHNLQHIYHLVEYYNDNYHVYRCICNNTFYEEHDWVLLSPYAIIPGPIRQVCSVCGVEKFE